MQVTAQQFRTMRSQLGYTQPEIANMFGVTRLSVINWEKGKHAISTAHQILMHQLWNAEFKGNKNSVQDYLSAYVRPPKGGKSKEAP